jgi:hypothetical protein
MPQRSFANELDIARAQRSKVLPVWLDWIHEHDELFGHVADFVALIEASGLQPGDLDDVTALVLGQLARLSYRDAVAELLAAVRLRAQLDTNPTH